MFEIGPEKILVILAVVFIFLGPKELPAAARKISAGMRKLRSLQDDLRAELGSVLELPTVNEPTVGTSGERAPDTGHRCPACAGRGAARVGPPPWPVVVPLTRTGNQSGGRRTAHSYESSGEGGSLSS